MLLVGPLIFMFSTSGDVYPGFQDHFMLLLMWLCVYLLPINICLSRFLAVFNRSKSVYLLSIRVCYIKYTHSNKDLITFTSKI